ncbi:MAG TPA: hypothetical protein VFV92_14830, partial [Candidatus Bathyarchaeia archaeon]|nr:hypothetical protein [Candidatus Bathyarchaeia archaeon]
MMWRDYPVARALGFSVHKLAARLGLHILPNHFYSCFADLRTLQANRALWARPSAMTGIHTTLRDQLQCLTSVLGDDHDDKGWREAYELGLLKEAGHGY